MHSHMACHTLEQALAILAGHHLCHQVSVLAVVLVLSKEEQGSYYERAREEKA